MSKGKEAGRDPTSQRPGRSAAGEARKQVREARLAEALRANLRRRKEALGARPPTKPAGDDGET